MAGERGLEQTRVITCNYFNFVVERWATAFWQEPFRTDTWMNQETGSITQNEGKMRHPIYATMQRSFRFSVKQIIKVIKYEM